MGIRRALAAIWLIGVALPASAIGADADPQVTVREQAGVYRVSAAFSVAQPAATALAVLTDYEGIPRFMPDVETSTVRERSGGTVIVEQEAVARLMMFSKRLHLVLEIQETAGVIRFKDRCARSFEQYEGTWTINERDGGAEVLYELTAKPSFDVPDFLLKRLLKRDAARKIERLRLDLAARAAAARPESHPDEPGLGR